MTQDTFNIIASIGIGLTFAGTIVGIFVSAIKDKKTTYKMILTSERTKNNNIAKEYISELIKLTNADIYTLPFKKDSIFNGDQLLTETRKVETKILEYEQKVKLISYYLNNDNSRFTKMKNTLNDLLAAIQNYQNSDIDRSRLLCGYKGERELISDQQRASVIDSFA